MTRSDYRQAVVEADAKLREALKEGRTLLRREELQMARSALVCLHKLGESLREEDD